MVVNCKETFLPKGVAVYSATYISVGQRIRNEGSHLIHYLHHSTYGIYPLKCKHTNCMSCEIYIPLSKVIVLTHLDYLAYFEQ